MPAPVARQIIGTNRLVGVSTHSLEQAQQAVRQGADYIGCGPVFPGCTKAFEKYVGTELLQQVSRQIDVPAFAIGGIDLENISEVVRAGFPRVAVTGVIRDSDDPAATASKLRALLGPLGDQAIAGRQTSADRKTSAGRQQSTAR